MLSFGLVGEKLGHSISPKIHKIILNQINLKGEYNLYPVDEENLEKLLLSFEKNKFKGVNVTIPYKVLAMEHLQTISEEAKKIGAINTIKFKDGFMNGYNTDYYGFLKSLEYEKINIKDKNVVILGTGGASKAIFNCVLDKEAKNITYVSRNKENCDLNNEKFNIISYDELKLLKETDIIINCTPVGMYPKTYESPVDKETLKKFKVAIDLIYNPKETLFLKFAKANGSKTLNGLYMLVSQAVESQKIWNDIDIDSEVTNIIYEKLLNDFK